MRLCSGCINLVVGTVGGQLACEKGVGRIPQGPVKTRVVSPVLGPSLCACCRHRRAHCTKYLDQQPPKRTWLDLGDIAYRQGPGCFHVAAEAYRGALQRAGDLFPSDQQVEHHLNGAGISDA